MRLKPSLRLLIITPITITISLLLGPTSYTQQANQSRLETATRRSQNAAKTIKVITGMPEDETIPTELFKRARAIGVFPDVVRMNLLFSQGMKGYGVICSRQPEGWSLPSYYAFGSTQLNLKLASFKSFDLVVFFMNENTINWFQAGRLQLKGIKAGVAGPVGKWTRAVEHEISGVNIIIYALIDGKLKGMNVEADFWDDAVINPDNNINKAIYGIKGREVLQGTAPKLSPGTSAVTAFRDILNEKYSVSGTHPLIL